MRRVHTLVAMGLVAASALSLGPALGYAWYFRSAQYRRSCAAQLSRLLGLPAEIEQVIPRARAAREYRGVRVYLPDRRDLALHCRQARLVRIPQPDDPQAYEIEIRGGSCTISTRTWLADDYRLVLESGLRMGFASDGPRRVRFSGLDLKFQHGQFTARLDEAAGLIFFENHSSGRAIAQCDKLNGYVSSQPVLLTARFSPLGNGIRIDSLEAQIPEQPVRVLKLHDLLGVRVESGSFEGQVQYAESSDQPGPSGRPGWQVRLSGRCRDLQLDEWTEGLAPAPWHGSAPRIELKELAIRNGQFERLEFEGVLTGVTAGQILTPWGLSRVGGELVLRVQSARFSPAGIERLVANGSCRNLSLRELTESLNCGRMAGQADLTIDDLTIEHNRLRSLDAELHVVPQPGENWIESRLINEAIARLVGIRWPSYLPMPARIEYTRLGLRAEVRDEVLYLFGTEGAAPRTILSVSVLDQELPLVVEPPMPIDLGSLLERVRAQAREYLARLTSVGPAPHWRLPDAPASAAPSNQSSDSVEPAEADSPNTRLAPCSTTAPREGS